MLSDNEDERAENALTHIMQTMQVSDHGRILIEQARASLRIARALERIADNSDQELRATTYTLREEYGFEL